mgnify:FL=1
MREPMWLRFLRKQKGRNRNLPEDGGEVSEAEKVERERTAERR